MGASPVEEVDQLSPSQRSTIRRAVKHAIARHDVEWAMRNTCAEFQHKYGISYEAIELLMQDALPSALPEELLSSGQRNRFRREFRAANSIPDPPRRERTIDELFEKYEQFFDVSHDTLEAVVGPEWDSVRPTDRPPGEPPVPVTAPSLPEPGQVVEVRGSTWAVANVEAQGLPLSPADDATAKLNHIVDLQSLDEDRLGEQLSVIWELEVGNTVTPAQGLPEQINPQGFDDPITLAGFIDAMRWGAVTSADPNRYQAPFWSGVAVEAYQLEPLRRALASPRANLLLADDVGLGKTIEAGLVLQELFLRHRARTAVIVCPPSLALKWQDEMRDKFGLQFVIVNSELMAQVRRTHGLHANPFQLYPRVIVSMAWLPQVRAQRLLRDVYAQAANPKLGKRFAFDVLIVDEAHHVAPSSPSAVASGRGYAVDTQRTVAVRQLADKCEHRLFLSATPHNGHPESFTALMEMIDPRRFSRGALLDARALKDVTVRRLKRDLKGKGFKDRDIKVLDFMPDDSEQEMFSLLDDIVTRSAKKNGTKPGGDIVTMLLKKRFLSSPFAFGMTISHYLDSRAGRGLTDDDYDDIFGEGQADEEEGLWQQDEAERLRESKSSDPLSAADPGQLKKLADWGLSYEGRPDSRLEKLIGFLDAVCRPDGKHWTNERVVVFTEYAHTVDWLQRVLAQRGYAERLAVIQGSTPTEDREYIRSQFTENPANEPVRVLLATDAAGEGIDLQTHCHRLVNFDIPFNPSRLEQRIGRIDRYGQTETPEVFHFVPESTSSTFGADADFMARIARKVAQVEQDLGSVNQVIGEEIQEHFARRKPAKCKAKGVDANEVINSALAGGVELNARLTQLEQGYGESRAELHLEPENLRRVVDTALQINHQLPLNPIGDQDTDAEVFELPALSTGWLDTLKGLDTRLKPGVLRPITFDPEAAEGRNDLVYVHLGHPIVQKAQRLLRRSLWSVDSPLSRVTAVVIDDLQESFVAAVTRMVLAGRGWGAAARGGVPGRCAAAGPARYERLAAGSPEPTDEAVADRMAAAIAVVQAAGMTVEGGVTVAAHLRRAIVWQRYSRGPVSRLHARCGADIARGSLRLWERAGGVPQRLGLQA